MKYLVARLIVFGLLLGTPVELLADGPFRRQVCSPSRVVHSGHHVDQVEIIEVQEVQAVAPAAPIIVQNNFAAPPAGLGTTIYGYSADPLQQLNAQPYRVDPSTILREASRLTDSSQQLTREALNVYQTLGADALGLAALQEQTAQLRARADLISSTEPSQLLVQQSTAPQPQVQRLQSGSQTICITPDGSGGFKIHIEEAQASIEPSTDEPENAEPVNGTPNAVHIMQQRCAACHTGSSAKGDVVLFADASTFLKPDAVLAERILDSVRSGAMPEGVNGAAAVQLTAREIAELQLYLGGE